MTALPQRPGPRVAGIQEGGGRSSRSRRADKSWFDKAFSADTLGSCATGPGSAWCRTKHRRRRPSTSLVLRGDGLEEAKPPRRHRRRPPGRRPRVVPPGQVRQGRSDLSRLADNEKNPQPAGGRGPLLRGGVPAPAEVLPGSRRHLQRSAEQVPDQRRTANRRSSTCSTSPTTGSKTRART